MKLHTDMMTLCDYAMVAQNNKPSIIGMFTEMGVQQFPGGMPQAVLFATIAGATASSTRKLTFRVTGKQGKEPFPPADLDVTFGPNGKTNLTVNIANFVFPEAGEYTFGIYDGKEKVGETVLQVFQTKPQGVTYEYKRAN